MTEKMINPDLTLGQIYSLGKRQIENFQNRFETTRRLQVDRQRNKIETSFENKKRRTWTNNEIH